jgi:precorrin-6x reductase
MADCCQAERGWLMGGTRDGKRLASTRIDVAKLVPLEAFTTATAQTIHPF